MYTTKCDTRWIVLLAFAGLFVAQSAFASGSKISDAALHDGGTLYGRLVDEEGIARKAVQVVLRHDQRIVAVTKTDAEGRFWVNGLRAGVFQVETAHGSQIYRLWAPRTAPPAAQPSILLVTGNEVVRGQDDFGERHHRRHHGIDLEKYGPAIRGAIAGGVTAGLTYWAFDYNASS